MKKILFVVVVALAMALALACAGAEIAAEPLTLNEECQAVVSISQEYAMFSFTPAETGMYNLTSYSNGDTVGVLFDSNMVELYEDDDSSQNNNFSLSCQLMAGETYYFGVGYYFEDTGTIPIKLTKQSGLCNTPEQNQISVWDYGSSRTLSVSLIRDDGTATYQWYVVENGQPTALQSQTKKYTIPCITKSEVYKCTVTQDGQTEDIFFNIEPNPHFNVSVDGDDEFKVQPNTPAEDPIVFKVAASALLGDITYQWYQMDNHERIEIEGATSDTYTPDIALADGEQCHFYACEAKHVYGDQEPVYWEESFAIVVENHFDVNAGVDDDETIHFTDGEPLVLEVEASCDAGANTLSYQWCKHQYDAEGDYWYEIPCEGANQPSFTITEQAEASMYYTCYVTDGYGYTKSARYYVKRAEGNNPQGDGSLTANALNGQTAIDAGADGSATMTVVAESSAGDPTFQWYQKKRDVLNDDDESYIRISNATGSSYTAQDVPYPTGYLCLVSDGVSYKNVKFTVDVPYQRFTVTSIPSEGNKTVERGDNLTLEVQATPDSHVSYLWFIEGNDFGTMISSGRTLFLSNIQRDATYRCLITDGYSSVNEYFNVQIDGSDEEDDGRVHAESRIYLAGASEEEIDEADESKIEVDFQNPEANDVVMRVFSQNDDVTYRWYKYEYRDDDEKYRYYTALPEDVGTGPSYTAENVSEECRYECRVFRGSDYDHFEFTISCDTGLTVTRKVNGEVSESSVIRIPMHTDVTLKVDATTNAGPLSYTWDKYDSDDGWHTLTDEHTDTIVITDFSTPVEYECYVEDQYNEREVYFDLRVDNQFSISQEEYDSTVNYGDSATLKVTVSCLDDSQLSCQWYALEPGGNYNDRVKLEGETSDTLQLNDIQESMQYIIEVHDGISMYTGESDGTVFEINVVSNLTARSADEKYNYSVAPGASQTMTVEATSSIENAEITYQWQRYNDETDAYEDIDDENGASYTLENVQASTYIRCVVQDGVSMEYVDYHIQVDSQLNISFDWDNSVFSVNYGETGTLLVVAESLVPQDQITYQWYTLPFDESTGYWGGSNRELLEGETSACLTVENVNTVKTYECEVFDGYQRCATSMTINIYNDDDYGRELNNYYYIPEGGSVQLAIDDGDLIDRGYTYYWYHDNNRIAGADDYALDVDSSLAGSVRVTRIDNYGNPYNSSATCYAGAPTAVDEGEATEVEITNTDHYKVFSFTPETSGDYDITIVDPENVRPRMVFFDSGYGKDYAMSDGTTVLLSAGRTYPIVAFLSDWYSTLYGEEDGCVEYSFTISKCEGEYEELDPVSLTLPYSPGTLFALPSPEYDEYGDPAYEYEGITTSDMKVITVDYGSDTPNVFTKGTGTADVTVVYDEGKLRTFHITVIDGSVIKTPQMLETIEDSAFEGDSAFNIVLLDENVSTVGEYAFRNSGIEVCWIRNEDAAIADHAFDGAEPTMIIPFGASDLIDYAEDHEIPYVFSSH